MTASERIREARLSTYAADVEQARWGRLASWLRTTEADDVLDAAVLGYWPQHEAQDLLRDYDLDDNAANLAELARLIDRVLRED